MIDDRYELKDYLGYGGTSKVFLSSQDGKDVALKVVRKDKNLTREQEKRLVFKEAQVIQKLGFHPNIVNCLDSCEEGIHNYLGVTEEVSYNVLEYCPNGSLLDFVRKNGPLGESMT